MSATPVATRISINLSHHFFLPARRDGLRTDPQHRRVPRVHLPGRRPHVGAPRRPLQQHARPRPRHPRGHPPSASTHDSQLNEHPAPSDDSDSLTPEIALGPADDPANKDTLAGNGANKRKAGRPSAVVDDDDEDG